MKLKGQTAIVTGAANSIGAQTALLLSHEGANVVLVDSTSCAHTLESIQKSRGKAVYLECLGEVHDEEFVKAAIARASDTFGELHILVNNDDMNAQATSLFIHAMTPYMVEQEYGRIVNVSSVSSGDSEQIFISSKDSISELTKQTAKELKEYGITCNAVIPVSMKNLDNAEANQINTATSIEETVLYFVSSETSFTTGHILKVDGGNCIESSNSSGI